MIYILKYLKKKLSTVTFIVYTTYSLIKFHNLLFYKSKLTQFIKKFEYLQNK